MNLAGEQVEAILTGFRVRFWNLINLRRSGIKGTRLFCLYAALVRPVIETNHIVYHPMLTRTQNKEIEKLQRLVTRLSFGFSQNYTTNLTGNGLETLETRREKAAKKFVGKIIDEEGRFARKWLIPRAEVETDLRRRRIYVEKRARTKRFYKSPLLYIQRIANDIMTAR